MMHRYFIVIKSKRRLRLSEPFTNKKKAIAAAKEESAPTVISMACTGPVWGRDCERNDGFRNAGKCLVKT